MFPLFGILFAFVALLSCSFGDFFIQKTARVICSWKALFLIGFVGLVTEKEQYIVPVTLYFKGEREDTDILEQNVWGRRGGATEDAPARKVFRSLDSHSPSPAGDVANGANGRFDTQVSNRGGADDRRENVTKRELNNHLEAILFELR